MFDVVHLIPTGVGAAIGGFAGDATPVAHLLASVCDRLITHPNALNAANLFDCPANAFYVEGLALDGWLAGQWVLRPTRGQRVGLLIDRAIERQPAGTLESLLNAANAVRAVHGLSIVGYRFTPRPLGCALETLPSGASAGRVADVAALLEGARSLIADGAEAIAILADLGAPSDSQEQAYERGEGVDPIGGLEAILSHVIVAELGVPAAHAPILPFDPVPPALVDPRAAAEYLGHTYLPCILRGLSRHPRLATPGEARADDLISPPSALVVPAGCLGGPGVLAAHARGVTILAVRENATVLGVTAASLGLRGVVEVDNYLEAAGVLACMRAGIDWRSCRRPLPSLQALGVAALGPA
ncbi:MAG TPA: DUF3326 domain-containing protein [Oscillatoriaceae cyanobacterium]